MDINTINEKIQISSLVKSENIIKIIESDIIVPDIKPDILKISSVDGNVYITKKEMGNGYIRIDGVIDVYVVYVADNETNQVKGINTILNFTETLDMLEVSENMIVDLKYSIGDVEYKVVNGRKIAVKCPVNVLMNITENKCVELIKDVENLNNIQKQKENIKFNELVGTGCENVSVKESVTIPNDLSPIGEILKVSACLEVKDYKVSYNKLLAKCDMKVRMVYIADNEKSEIESFETRIPVTGFIDLTGINDQMNFDVDYNISYLYVKPIYQDLKANLINVEAEVEFVAKAYIERENEIITDIYNPKNEIKYNVESNKLKCKKNLTMEKVKIEQLITVAELMNSNLLDLKVKAMITDKHFLEDKVSLNGNLDLNIIYYNKDKKIVENKTIELPFNQTVKLNKKINEDDINICLDIEYIKYDLQGVGQLQFESQIVIDISEIEDVEFNGINNIIQTTEEIKPIASIVVYYVKEGDTLWKIAKKYRSTIESIKQINDLRDDILRIGQQLLIPKVVYRVPIDNIN